VSEKYKITDNFISEEKDRKLAYLEKLWKIIVAEQSNPDEVLPHDQNKKRPI
jgi:hypothetical protein